MTSLSSLRLTVIVLAYYVLAIHMPVTSAFLPSHVHSRQQKQIGLASKKAELSPEEYEVKLNKAMKAMTAFTNKYLENTDTKLCTDLSIPAVVIKGLADHKVDLGAPLCPCRFYEDKEAEAKNGYWNCPCVPMRERHECHCMLFLTEDNDFSGEETVRVSSVCFAMTRLNCCLKVLAAASQH